jgi:hypothetical protein
VQRLYDDGGTHGTSDERRFEVASVKPNQQMLAQFVRANQGTGAALGRIGDQAKAPIYENLSDRHHIDCRTGLFAADS